MTKNNPRPIDALSCYKIDVKNAPLEIKPGTPVHPVFFKDYREHAFNCDILLHNPTTYFGRAIARHTGGNYGFNFSHVEAVLHWKNVSRIMSCGYQEGEGGRAIPLEKVVQQRSGLVHVFRVSGPHWPTEGNPRQCISEHLAGDLGEKYGWKSIWLQLASLLPLTRFLMSGGLFQKLAQKASKSAGYGICSQHIARSFEKCGLRLIDKPTALVTPNDIAQSALTTYIATLVKE